MKIQVDFFLQYLTQCVRGIRNVMRKQVKTLLRPWSLYLEEWWKRKQSGLEVKDQVLAFFWRPYQKCSFVGLCLIQSKILYGKTLKKKHNLLSAQLFMKGHLKAWGIFCFFCVYHVMSTDPLRLKFLSSSLIKIQQLVWIIWDFSAILKLRIF